MMKASIVRTAMVSIAMSSLSAIVPQPFHAESERRDLGAAAVLDPADADRAGVEESLGQDPSERGHGPDGDSNGQGDALGHFKKHLKADTDAGASAGVARGDFNGDGFADLAVGVPFEDVDEQVLTRKVSRVDAGAVTIIYGSANGLTATDTTVPASQFWSQETPGVASTPGNSEQFGAALAAGDFNGDGVSDLAIAVPREATSGTTVGAVQILYGTRNVGLTSTGNHILLLPDLFASAVADAATLRVGNALVWGDFNGDSFGDLAVEGQYLSSSDTARISVVFGSASGLNRGIPKLEFSFSNASVAGGATDVALAAGNLNGDAFSDLVVGLPGANIGAASDAGQVRVLYGSNSGPTTTGGTQLHQNIESVPEVSESNDRFGFALATGDFDGDTIDDLAVGVPFEDVDGLVEGLTLTNLFPDGGIVHVFFGSSGGVKTTGSQLLTQGSSGLLGDPFPEAGDQFGYALAAGKFDDDSSFDLAVGAPGETLNGKANAGAVSAFYSQSGVGLTGVGLQYWTEISASPTGTPEANDRFGSSLTAWNFGKNQFTPFPAPRTIFTADLAIGIPGREVFVGVIEGPETKYTDAGAVRVIYGSPTGLSVAVPPAGTVGPAQLWTQGSSGVPDDPENGDGFGAGLY